jgi:hypothetical protein
MLYVSKRQKVMNYLLNRIVPNIKEGKDLRWLNVDVEKLCAVIQVDCGVSEEMAISCIKAIIKTGDLIVKDKILTIPSEKEIEWLVNLRKEEKEAEAEATKILSSDSKWEA